MDPEPLADAEEGKEDLEGGIILLNEGVFGRLFLVREGPSVFWGPEVLNPYNKSLLGTRRFNVANCGGNGGHSGDLNVCIYNKEYVVFRSFVCAAINFYSCGEFMYCAKVIKTIGMY
jgi:hypothetical protein